MSPLPSPWVFRVEYLDGMGWPRRTNVEHRDRLFADPRTVRRVLAEIEAVPTHNTLIGVWRGRVAWDPAFTRVEGVVVPHFDVRPERAAIEAIRSQWITDPEEKL